MSDLLWLPKYSGETTRELIAMENSFRKDSIVMAFEQGLHQKAFRIGDIGRLTNEERIVLAIEALEREINNGGYVQFLQNTEAELVAEVVAALDRIGRDDLARLTQRAIEIAASHAKITRRPVRGIRHDGAG
jgi:hypothetical protein